MFQTQLLTIDELISRVQASETEIRSALLRLNSFIKDGESTIVTLREFHCIDCKPSHAGHYRIMTLEFEQHAFELILAELDATKVIQ